MKTIKAVFEELPNLLDLQKLANVSEIELLDNSDARITKELEDENEKKIILKIMDKDNNEYFSIKLHLE